MKDFLSKIDKFFVKQPVNMDNSSDSMEQMGLLRKCASLYIVYYIVLGFVIGFEHGMYLSLVPFAGALLMLLVEIGTYYSGKLSITMAGATTVMLVTFVLEVLTGGSMGAELIVFSLIPLIFSSIRLSTIAKVSIGAFVTTVHLVISILHSLGYLDVNVIEKGGLVIRIFSELVFVSVIMLVSYYFCRQYTQAEHQVYIANRQLKKMASLDPLTGLMNRRGMADVLPDMEFAYKEGKSGLAIAIGDIDFFKKVNDTYGHDCGDYVLKTVSSYFAKFMEDKGEICRWGGEEFLFAFNNKNADDVFVMLNDIRHTIKHMRFQFNDIEFKVTMTFGLEEYTPYAQLETTIKKADEKLYLGKESGRDKVVY